MSGMDQLFDRFGDLLRSWTAPNGDAPGADRPFAEPRGRSADPLFDEAMDELDAFLEDDKEKQARLKAEREARDRREREAREARARAAGSGAYQGSPSGPPAKLIAAYKTLGLPFGASFAEVKTAYKRLLKEHHPDRHGSSPEAQRKATETSARINDAMRVIETWRDTGSLGDER